MQTKSKFLIIGVILALFLGLVYMLVKTKMHNSSHLESPQSTNQYVTVSQTKSVGVAKIGGPFHLKDHNGKTVTDKNFRGLYMLVYFGYTFCPDICPTALHGLTQALGMLPKNKLNKVTPIFITIDPKRDDIEQLKLYRQNFHDKFVMLTGDEKSVKKAARAYKAYYAKAPAPEGEKEDSENYAIDHSSIIYVMGPDGKFITHFNHNLDPKAMYSILNRVL